MQKIVNLFITTQCCQQQLSKKIINKTKFDLQTLFQGQKNGLNANGYTVTLYSIKVREKLKSALS